ncbi:MAG: hypothetical protein KGI58_03715, partial [Patescibacteria group bacterium]|nr:hypothetical protein [Patescibacteria group bacterium]
MKNIKKIFAFFLILSFISFNSSSLIVFAENNNNHPPQSKINICHEDGDSGNWNALSVDENGWNGHSSHTNDYLYNGPTKDGKPDNKDKKADSWCKNNIPQPPAPETSTLNATKIVCDSEADLPNWGYGGPEITSTTATDFISTHPNCKIEPWTFEWAPDGTSNPGDNIIGPAGGAWTPFTDTATIPVGVSTWVREQMQEGYIPFSGATTDLNSDSAKNSAELYCDNDVLNYDNYDKTNDTIGPRQNHFCVAFNAKVPPTPTTGSIEITKYSCPEGTSVTRSSNGVGGTIPNGCTPEVGKTFGYVHG